MVDIWGCGVGRYPGFLDGFRGFIDAPFPGENLGACALGAPACWGQSVSSAKDISDLFRESDATRAPCIGWGVEIGRIWGDSEIFRGSVVDW